MGSTRYAGKQSQGFITKEPRHPSDDSHGEEVPRHPRRFISQHGLNSMTHMICGSNATARPRRGSPPRSNDIVVGRQAITIDNLRRFENQSTVVHYDHPEKTPDYLGLQCYKEPGAIWRRTPVSLCTKA